MKYYCDEFRHLICIPYSVENLHRMADDLGIKRCWFHSRPKFSHYDIPKRRIEEIKQKCTVVAPVVLLKLMEYKFFF